MLKPTKIVDKGDFYISPSGKKMPDWFSKNKSWKVRSTTFQGIADAMAEQWGDETRLPTPVQQLSLFS